MTPAAANANMKLHQHFIQCSNVTTLLMEVEMPITTLSSRELNQDVGRAKKAAVNGPVFITDRGKPAHVLLNIQDYQRLIGKSRNLVEALSMPGLSETDFDPPRATIPSREVDFP
jgi:PHD/YefM family antitoxin component YafN of YafNO toxin-antitoxin module